MAENMGIKKTKVLPGILLIGTGRFGKNHLRVLKELEKNGIITFKGAVVRDEDKRKEIEKEYGIKIYEKLTASLLKNVSAIDIVTPPETHFEIVKKCLPYTNVFVEKPLVTNTKEGDILEKLAHKYNRDLVVGHIYRYHPVTEKLKDLFTKKGSPNTILGTFINPASTDQRREPSIELIHLFDIVHFIWGRDPETISSRKNGRTSCIDIRYTKNSNAHFTLGWSENRRKRTLTFKYIKHTVEADFIANTITEKKGNIIKIHNCDNKEDLIRKELIHFVQVLKKQSKARADVYVGRKIVEIAQQAIPKKIIKPTVAVIGGGIFGTSVAAELGKFCSVTIFEKNSCLMQEGTYVNCFRHHVGYHYPRSSETVVDIQNSSVDFEAIHKKAIISSYPTYYGIAKKNSRVSPKEFISFCKKHNLLYKRETLPLTVLSKNKISMCIKVPEMGYHYETLTKIVENRLRKQKKSIKILSNSTVVNCAFTKDSKKVISYLRQNVFQKQQKFDFVVNATYSNINLLANWLSFEHFTIRIDLAEVLILQLKIPPLSITIIDGPFATLMPTGNPNEFTLYHVKESIIDRYVPKNGLVKRYPKKQSNQESILRESEKLFPMLKDAVVVESRIVHRAVRAYKEHDDSRVVDLIDHGFGCWSILSGKILSSVTTGKKVADIIRETTKIFK